MAQVVGVYNVAHSPFCYTPPERWNEIRATRQLREDVPMEDLPTAQAKGERIQAGFKALREHLAEKKPDVIVIFGDDQLECFDFNNYPSVAVYVGEEFEGHLATPRSTVGAARTTAAPEPAEAGAAPMGRGYASMPKAKVTAHSELAVSILTGLMERKFDPAFCMDMPKPDRGIGHAFMRPYESITDHETPVIPILLNCYYSPQITAERCYELGKAVRDIIEKHDSNLKVAVIGSGGLWHTPGAKDAWLNEDFDQGTLKYMAAGDIRGMAEHFDHYEIPNGDSSQAIGPKGRGSTGMPGFGGPQGGTRETCNWIAAAAVADGSTATVVDYVPVYSSPVGAAFAYWDKP
jgi:hypothetical protein